MPIIELFDSRGSVHLEVEPGEPVGAAALRDLRARTRDDPQLQLLIGEVAQLVEKHLAEVRAQEAERPSGSPDEKMSALAESFPTLVGRPGVRPWDATRLAEHLSDVDLGSGEYAAACFVLHVYNSEHELDLAHAVSVWDHAHRAAFKVWAGDPWTL